MKYFLHKWIVVIKSLHSPVTHYKHHKFTEQCFCLMSTYEPIFVKTDMMPTLLFWDVQFFIGFFDIVDIILIQYFLNGHIAK